MSNSKVFIGGMPYGPDIRRLADAFPLPSLKEGRIISHEELAGCLEPIARGSARYYAVVNAWISRQRNDNGVFIRWEHTRGIKVLDPSEVLETAETRTKQKARQLGKAVKTFGWVDRSRLDQTGQKRYDHQIRVANALRESVDSARKELAVNLAPVRSLPRPQREAV